MTINEGLWSLVRCIACARPADHILELLLPVPMGTLTPALVGFCRQHYREAKRTPAWKHLRVIDARALEPKGAG